MPSPVPNSVKWLRKTRSDDEEEEEEAKTKDAAFDKILALEGADDDDAGAA